LALFFDDSGTHAGSPAVVIGGLLGTDEQYRSTALLRGSTPELRSRVFYR
jgi:hypothetical protein